MTPIGWIATGSLLAAISVAAGAFGAHGLRAIVSPTALGTFEIAVRYQMYHALALLALGVAAAATPIGVVSPRLLAASGWLFIAGTVIFCGSLYLLALGAPRWFGAVAPIGGGALIAGWICLALAAMTAARV